VITYKFFKCLRLFNYINHFRGFESETDTEEYEKIGQTSIDKQKPMYQSVGIGTSLIGVNDVTTSMDVVIKKDVEMVTDDNMGTGLEVERLKTLLILMHQASQESINLLRQQISTIKEDATNEKQAIQAELDNLLKSWDDLKAENKNHERELVQRLTVDHELEMNDLRQTLFIKDDEINTLKSEKEILKGKMQTHEDNFKLEKAHFEKKILELEANVKDLEQRIVHQTVQREAAIKEVKEKMHNDHRNEIESLRCKFKLMTSMERSPSDTSLEKIERPDIIDITSHEAIIEQMKENFEEEKSNAIKAAIEKDRQTLRLVESTGKLSVITSSPGKSPRDSQEIFRRILDEKDRQLDQIREREQYLMKETMRLKETIQSLTDIELNESQVSLYKDKLEAVQNEKKKLEKDLEKEKTKRAKLSALAQGSGGITINSCSKDDIVLIVWNFAHEQYTVIQDSTVLYFLHAESYHDMRLATVPSNSFPNTSFCIGKVIEKEYCHAKKDENRYKVSKGTKFYRVKVRPRSPMMMERSMALEKKRSRKSTGEFDHFKSSNLN
jgi:RB1-inducible coiled-coil protein 1